LEWITIYQLEHKNGSWLINWCGSRLIK